MTKICVIVHRLGPYHRARLQALAARSNLSVIELTEEDATYAWDKVHAVPFRRRTLFKDLDRRPELARRLPAVLSRALDEDAPEVVAVPGWSHAAALAALSWCRSKGVPALLMSESQAQDHPRSWWKESFKRSLVAKFQGALVGGQPHMSYLASLGMDPARIFPGYDVVDNDYFREGAAKVRSQSVQLRRSSGLPQRFFLASSRFIVRKNLELLLWAYASYAHQAGSQAFSLVVLGDGELKTDLLELRTRLGLAKLALFPGFVQYGELPLYYGLASCFIHPALSEPWGLVVNEAMASSLPVIVSRACGCAHDLVWEGANGFTFSPGDEIGLAKAMQRIASPENDLAAMGGASLDIVRDWSPAVFAENMMRAAGGAVPTASSPGTLEGTLLRAISMGRTVLA